MTRRLFLTGPIGCGKSTSIADALGEKISQCGGFLTRRYRNPHLHFTLETPNGEKKDTFLDFSGGKPEVNLQVFSEISWQGKVLLLDEIGGIELLNPDFTATLESMLNSDIPILGVIKGQAPAGALIKALCLTDAYTLAAARLWDQLRRDPQTQIYECGQFDKTALHLAKQWTEVYLHD